MREPNGLRWGWLLSELGYATLLVVSFSLLVWMLGCASQVHVTKTADGCEITGTFNTGTSVACTRDGVVVERNSAADVTNGAVETLIRSIGGLF